MRKYFLRLWRRRRARNKKDRGPFEEDEKHVVPPSKVKMARIHERKTQIPPPISELVSITSFPRQSCAHPFVGLGDNDDLLICTRYGGLSSSAAFNLAQTLRWAAADGAAVPPPPPQPYHASPSNRTGTARSICMLSTCFLCAVQ